MLLQTRKNKRMSENHAAMLAFYSARHAAHAPKVEFLHGRLTPYLEMPERIEHIYAGLQRAGLITLAEVREPVTKADLARIHDAKMIDYVYEMSENARERVRREYSLYHIEDQVTEDDYYYTTVFPLHTMKVLVSPSAYHVFDGTAPFGQGTWEAVCASASLAKAGAMALLRSDARMAYALCRPPGHHAGRNFIGGYCYFNNAALAANLLLERGKVAIIDIDYHHGNGTQDIFWEDPNVLFTSIHAEPKDEYPFYAGYSDEIGQGEGEGTTLNYPLKMGVSVEDYMTTFEQLLAQIRKFNPASLVVSIGFDTYKDDAMGTFKLHTPEYFKLAHQIGKLGLPTLFVQEGGYNVGALGELATAFVQGALASSNE